MYSDGNLVYVCIMLESIEKINIYAGGYTEANSLAWNNDQRDFNAIWALLLVVGEESKKLDNDFKKEFQNIPWPTIAGMRNHLAHDYRGIDHNRVWEIVKSSLPKSKNILVDMIDKIAYVKEMLKEALDSPYYRPIQYLRDKLND